MGKGHGGSSRFNLWACYFWFVEITFAVIGGTTEMWVYRQYMSPGQFSDVEAFARALVTQLAIVGFGAAGIKAMSSINGWGKWPMTFLAFAFALGFAFVTFDLMLVSAIAFRNGEALGTADSWPITTPWGTLPGQLVTMYIIAGVPFFQWAMSVFGPIITKDRALPSVEEVEEQTRRTLAMAKLDQAKREANIGGLLATARQLGSGIQELRGKGMDDANPGQSAMQTSDNHRANPAESDAQILDNGNAAEQAAPSAPPKRGPWKSSALLAYIALEYPQVTLSETLALDTIKTLGNGTKKGTAYVASIPACKAWARKAYGVPASEQTPALVG